MSGKLFILCILVLAACCFLQASAHPDVTKTLGASTIHGAFQKAIAQAEKAASKSPKPADVAGAAQSAVPDATTVTGAVQTATAPVAKAASNAPKPADLAGAVPDAATVTGAVQTATAPVANAASNAPKPADVAGAVESAVPDANAKDTVKDVKSAVSRR
nr:microtubule-associated protein homolog maph-1.1 [Helicoverpa armigera]XP_049703600.1 microtubule-associated protein homolog maph-1.1 [Helicoverpa armigera]